MPGVYRRKIEITTMPTGPVFAKQYNILNLGAGVQSTTVLLMSIKGVLPLLDSAVFADTGWEPAAVYKHQCWLKGEAYKAGIPVYTVKRDNGNLRKDAVEFMRNRRSEDGKRWASVPLFIKNPDGSIGIMNRQCTKEYKVEPIHKFIRTEILGLSFRQRVPAETTVVQWFGISADERQRIKTPRHRWS